MGNCSPKPKPQLTRLPIRLYGSESCPLAYRIRISLLYKSVPVEFVAVPDAVHRPFLQLGSEIVKAPADSLFHYIDSKFTGSPSAVVAAASCGSDAAKAVIELQHRSMERHVAGIERWVRDLVAGKEGVGGKRRRLGDWYGRLVELMLEHAQMEERFLFPLLERAADDSGVCREAIEEHGRDLPMMNGIKEDIKSLVAMQAGDPFYQEALLNLYIRLKKFQEHCHEHFEEEEKNLVPLIESAERRRRDEGEEPWSHLQWARDLMRMMESTHSPHLFPFFVAGLLPSEAMHYIDLVCTCIAHDDDDTQVVELLRSLVRWFDGTLPLSWIHHSLASEE